MADFEAPIPLEETQEAEDPLSALMALAREQEKRRQQGLERLRAMSAAQAGQAQGLRGAAALLSAGQNPLIQGLQRELGANAAQLEGLAAQAGARADSMDRSGVDPLGLARLQQLAEYQKGQLAQRKADADAKAQAAKDKAAAGAAAASAKAAAAETARAEKLAALERKITGDLRKEFEALGPVREYRLASVAFDKVQNAAQDSSAPGDLALIFAYMKTLDPTSAVRETEFANAQNAAGIPDRIRNTWNKALEGERLNPDQRREFIRSARSQYEASRKAYEEQAIRYAGLAPAGAGERVIGGPVPTRQPTTTRTTAAKAMPTDASGNLSLEDVPTPGFVRVVSPEGKTGRVPRANLDRAKARGYREAQ